MIWLPKRAAQVKGNFIRTSFISRSARGGSREQVSANVECPMAEACTAASSKEATWEAAQNPAPATPSLASRHFFTPRRQQAITLQKILQLKSPPSSSLFMHSCLIHRFTAAFVWFDLDTRGMLQTDCSETLQVVMLLSHRPPVIVHHQLVRAGSCRLPGATPRALEQPGGSRPHPAALSQCPQVGSAACAGFWI